MASALDVPWVQMCAIGWDLLTPHKTGKGTLQRSNKPLANPCCPMTYLKNVQDSLAALNMIPAAATCSRGLPGLQKQPPPSPPPELLHYKETSAKSSKLVETTPGLRLAGLGIQKPCGICWRASFHEPGEIRDLRSSKFPHPPTTPRIPE